MSISETRRTVPQPGSDPVDRLKHVNTIYAKDEDTEPDDHAITATHSFYGKGIWTGLTYGDLQALEKTITLGATAERIKIVHYIRSLSRDMERDAQNKGIGAAVARFLNEIADKINSYQDTVEAPSWGPGSNSGHGHVWPRPDGVRARCMGPGGCLVCTEDKIKLLNSQGLSAS